MYNSLKVCNGELSIGHRPKLKEIPLLKSHGFTHVVTILSNKEGAGDIIKKVVECGLKSIWLDLPNAREVDDLRKLTEIKEALIDIIKLLEEGESVFIHCSAGIHRTGMITYTIFLMLGDSPDVANTRLQKLRNLTADNVGQSRLLWAENKLLKFCKS